MTSKVEKYINDSLNKTLKEREPKPEQEPPKDEKKAPDGN